MYMPLSKSFLVSLRDVCPTWSSSTKNSEAGNDAKFPHLKMEEWMWT